MGAKLKSILGPIPWSLVIRAFIFGGAWFFLPFWIFVLLGLYLYFFPLFSPGRLWLPFLITLITASLLPSGIITAIFLGFIFALILGIKDLIFINRAAAYEILVLLLLFTIFLLFYMKFENWQSFSVLWWSVLASILFFFLVKSFINYSDYALEWKDKIISLGLITFLIWQLLWSLLFLPLTFFNQAALLFFISALFIEFITDYLRGILTSRKIFSKLGIFAAVSLVVFIATNWSL